MDKVSKRRLAENEVIFRQANLDIKEFLDDAGAAHNTLIPFFCECSDPNCRGRIELSAAAYQRLHQNRRQFVVIPGHEIPAIENVVVQDVRYFVVEKSGSMPNDEDIDTALKRLTM